MKQANTVRLLAVLLLAAFGAALQAAEVVKTNNTANLNTAASWTNSVATSVGDVAVFDSTLEATAKSYALGGAMTWGGISFRDALAAQIITDLAALADVAQVGIQRYRFEF